MAALGGAAAGATAGGVTGALVGLGIPEIEAKVYEGKLHSGKLLMSVHTEDAEERKRAGALLKQMGAEHISSTTEAAVPRDARRQAWPFSPNLFDLPAIRRYRP